MKLVVILPTYNERENIITLLAQLRSVLAGVSGYSISYLVVDDNSPDGTRDAVLEYRKKYKDVYILSGKKEGLGKALLRGMTYAVEELGADILLQMDADLSHDPKSVPHFIKALEGDQVDFAVGSRYIPGGSIPYNWGIHRKIFSICANSIVRLGLGHMDVHDWTGGFRAYTKKFYEEVHAEMGKFGGYLFQIAFLHKAIHHGAVIHEVPIHFTDRLHGRSKIPTAKYIISILLYIVEERFNDLRSGPFGKFAVVGGIGFIINALILVLLHDWFKWSASVANLIGAAAAIFSNYNLNNVWTFQKNKISTLREYIIKLIQFFATSLFGVIVIQTGVITLGVYATGDRFYFVYFLIGTALLLIWNYFMYSRVIWRKK